MLHNFCKALLNKTTFHTSSHQVRRVRNPDYEVALLYHIGQNASALARLQDLPIFFYTGLKTFITVS